jgi:hypothetical protein
MTAKKSQERSLRISPPQKATTGLSFAELGLLIYMLQCVDADGLFKQHVDDIAEAGHVSHGTAFSLQKNLITKRYVEVVEKPRRGLRGRFQTAAVLRPRPVQKTDSVNVQKIDSVEVVENPQQSPSQQTPKSQTLRLGRTESNLTVNTVHSHEHRELSVTNGDGIRAGRTVVPTDSVAPAQDTRPKQVTPEDVIASLRAKRKVQAEEIRRRNAQ